LVDEIKTSNKPVINLIKAILNQMKTSGLKNLFSTSTILKAVAFDKDDKEAYAS
jgi:hypothetical protein